MRYILSYQGGPVPSPVHFAICKNRPGMKLSYFILVVFPLTYTSIQAQPNPDSLWQSWNNTALHDTARLGALNQLAYNLLKQDPDSARILAQTQLNFAREKGSLKWQARAFYHIALSYRFQSEYEKALQHYGQSIDLLEKSGDRSDLSSVYGSMGDVYRLQSNFPKAIDCINKSLSLAEETGNRKKMADGYVSIATIYFETPGNHAKILEYLEKARPIYETLNNREGLALVYGNMAAVYLDQNDFEKSLAFNSKCLAIQEETGDEYGMATSLHNRAVVLTELGRFREALADFEREKAIFEAIGDQEGLADAYNSIGDLWIRQKRYPEAVRACSNALEMARKLGSPNLKEVGACNCLYLAYLEQGNYKQALQYLGRYVSAKDSLQHSETVQKLKQMEIERQTVADSLNREKERFRLEMAHQQAIRQKDKTQTLLTAAGLGILVVALAVWVRMLYFRRRSQQLQIRSEELEKQQLLNEIALLRTQVNPHFLFNSLSILSSLVHADANLAEQFIEQLSRSYRYILEQKEQSLVTLRTELEFIKSYSFLLKIRFEKKFNLDIRLPDEILDNKKIAPLTLQLLIENAVKHNRMSEKEPLTVTVTIENGELLTVKNRLQPRATAPDSTGVGLQNILNRYALLTDRPVWAGETEGAFVVRIPLL